MVIFDSPGLVWGLLVVVLGGAGMLTWGLAGRRVGTDPYCRRCRYNLTGAQGERCPECGAALTARSIVVGRRRRRAAAIVAGALLLLPALAGLGGLAVGRVRNVDWNTHCPIGTLLWMAKADDPKALAEITQRLSAGKLAVTECPRIIEVALAKHGARIAPPHVLDWAKLLDAIHVRGGFSRADRDRFYSNLAPMKLLVRPIIRQDDWFVLEAQTEDRGLALYEGAFGMRIKSLRIDGEPKSWRAEPSLWGRGAVPNAGPLRLVSQGDLPSPGKHLVRCVIEQRVLDWLPASVSGTRGWKQEITLDGIVQVRSATEADPISLTSDNSVVPILQGNIRVQQPQFALLPFMPFELYLDMPEPIGLAFDVLAVTADAEIPLGTVSWLKGARGAALVHRTTERAIFARSKMRRIVLRATREAAGRSLDCFEIWDGQLDVSADDSTLIGIYPPVLCDDSALKGDFPHYDRRKLDGFPPDPAKAPFNR